MRAAFPARTLDGYEECSGECVDTHGTDASNCGGCGMKCNPGQVCAKGGCIVVDSR